MDRFQKLVPTWEEFLDIKYKVDLLWKIKSGEIRESSIGNNKDSNPPPIHEGETIAEHSVRKERERRELNEEKRDGLKKEISSPQEPKGWEEKFDKLFKFAAEIRPPFKMVQDYPYDQKWPDRFERIQMLKQFIRTQRAIWIQEERERAIAEAKEKIISYHQSAHQSPLETLMTGQCPTCGALKQIADSLTSPETK